ncbi:MAG: PilN domain-containing protein [Gammaproteobacteria bacterium]|nr:PilN domain-containing protein [Gammaproteobacteria bacterium]
MKYLAKIRDHWAALQDRHTLGAASAVLALDGGRLYSLGDAAVTECTSSSPDAVARAALSLGLKGGDAGVILLLPPGRFSTSEHQFSNLDRDALLRALHFQQDELFPGMEPLVVTAACSPSPSLALWIRQSELECWRQAFALAGLNLLAVGPRNLLQQYLGATGFSSLDGESMLEATIDPQGDLTGWSIKENVERNGSGGDGTSFPWKEFKGRLRIRRSDYLFLQERRNNRPKFILWLGLAVVVVGLLLTYAVLPIAQQFDLRADLEQQVASLRAQAGDVLTLREQVMALEDHLAPVLNYPKTSIGSLLVLLDRNLPRESWLLSMRVTESIVEIEGVSSDPSRIIVLLSARPEFSEVAFSRAIQLDPQYGASEGKSRFGIRMKLSGIDFDDWRQSVRKGDE